MQAPRLRGLVCALFVSWGLAPPGLFNGHIGPQFRVPLVNLFTFVFIYICFLLYLLGLTRLPFSYILSLKRKGFMHLKSIPEEVAREIKSAAASLGMSPSQYFVHLHYKNLPDTDSDARAKREGQGRKYSKRKGR